MYKLRFVVYSQSDIQWIGIDMYIHTWFLTFCQQVFTYTPPFIRLQMKLLGKNVLFSFYTVFSPLIYHRIWQLVINYILETRRNQYAIKLCFCLLLFVWQLTSTITKIQSIQNPIVLLYSLVKTCYDQINKINHIENLLVCLF